MAKGQSTLSLLLIFFYAIHSISTTNQYYCTPSQTTDIPLIEGNLSYVSSVNFPNALPDYFQKKCTVNIQPEQGFGVRLLFEQFFISPDDSLMITIATGEQFIRYGSQDDPERGTIAFYASPGPMNLVFQQNTPKANKIKHAGFKAILKPFNLTTDKATQCGGERYINETYFVTSFGYPQDYGSNRNCFWKFTADVNIRVLFYDFQSDNATDLFIMRGQGIESTSDTTLLGGPNVTSDLAVAFYYRKSVQIDFISGNGSSYSPRKFSFVVDSYPDRPTIKRKCVGDGVLHDMSKKKSVVISTAKYISSAYTDYLDCKFSFTNPPPSHIIYLNMVFESERCCDTMTADGIGKDYIFQGQRNPAIYFANSPNVSLVFVSDGVRTAAGFRGTVSTLNCECKNVTIDVEAGKEYWIESPGYGTIPTYCPKLSCFWEVRFSRNQTIEITSFSLGLRLSDVLSITDYKGDTIASLTIASNSASEKFLAITSTGYVAFHFVSVPLDYIETGPLIDGFRIHVKSNPIIYNRSESILLSDDNSVSLVTANISSEDAFLWHVKVRKYRTTTLYAIGSLSDTGVILDVFDGPDVDASVMAINQFYNSTASATTTNEIRSSGDSLTFRVIGTSQMHTSFIFSGILSDIVNDSYALYCSEPLVKGFLYEDIFDVQLPSNTSLNDNSTAHNNSTTSNNLTSSNQIPPNAICTVVCRAVVQTSELRSGLALQVLGVSAPVQVYKGITLSKKALLASVPPYPNFIFGNDVTFSYPAAHPPKTVGVRSTIMLRNYAEPPTTNETVGYLFSPDFLSDTDLGRIYQRYELTIKGEPVNGFQVEIISPINNCQILLQGDYDGTPALYDELLSGAPSINVCVTNMAVTYRSNGGFGKGMFLKYRKATNNNCESLTAGGTNSLQSGIVAMFIAIFIIIQYCSM